MLHEKRAFKADCLFSECFSYEQYVVILSVQEENLCITFGVNLMFDKVVAM
jgi:hypothetical protein